MSEKQETLQLDLRGITNRQASTSNSMIGSKQNTQTSRTDRYIPFQFRDKRLTEEQLAQLQLSKEQKQNLSFINTPHKKQFDFKDKFRRESRLPTETERPQPTERKNKTFYYPTMPSKNQIPKLRQTGSTQCQSPKSNNLVSSTKLSDFNRIKLLGKGKFGDVYLVMHKKTGFIAALKIIRKDDLLCGSAEDNQKAINQLVRQIKIQAYLDHPNLIQLYDYFSDNTSIYLLLELACDGHLFDALERSKALSEETTSILVREIVEGIDHMHTRHIIHRDIKLENVVLSHGMAKICDFGWSVYCPKEFRTTLCGTPLYLSPEILSGRQYNKKIDTWAIGLLTHELFTGQNPFNIQHKNDLNKIITEDFQMQKGSPEMRSFITFILRKNPSKRPDTDTIKRHPFIEKYKGFETSEELCRLVYPAHYFK